ncbi:hypothetical protein ACJX0J_014570, partial [Zea mays]
ASDYLIFNHVWNAMFLFLGKINLLSNHLAVACIDHYQILMLAASNMISENFYWQEQQQAVHFQAHQKLFSGHLNNKLLNNCFSFNLFSTYYLPSLNIYVTKDKIIEVILFFIVPSSWFMFLA